MTIMATNIPHFRRRRPLLKSPVPFMDLRAQYRALEDEVLKAIREVAESTAYVLGPKVSAFERPSPTMWVPGSVWA